MRDKRFTIKPQDDYWAVVDNYNEDKVCIINGIHTEIEAIWLCDFMNEQQDTISQLQDLCGESDGENAKLRIENKKLREELELTANTKLYSRRKLEEDNEQLKKQLSACKEGQQNLMEEHRNDEEALDKIWNIIKELYGDD